MLNMSCAKNQKFPREEIEYPISAEHSTNYNLRKVNCHELLICELPELHEFKFIIICPITRIYDSIEFSM